MFDPDYDGAIVHDMKKLREATESSEWRDYSRVFWRSVDKTDPDDVEHLVALYDGVIAEMDGQLQGLLTAIERRAAGAA